MTTTLDQLRAWLGSNENEHLEFKEAKNNFHFDKLVKYCAALANEGGGRVVLGATDAKPRRIVGTQAFENPERTKGGLVDRLHLRVEIEELAHPDGRVLIFHVPSRPLGMPIQVDGAYWMRGGEDLVPMTVDMLQRILAEACPDFSAEICPRANIADLDALAIEEFRSRWLQKSKNAALADSSVQQLLMDAELINADGVTYAALVLLGTRAALGRHLAAAEVVLEYRSTEAAGPANQREEYRKGFLNFYDQLWNTVNLRNDVQHFQDGLLMYDIPTFSEGAIREAILNAISHRDYRLPGSVFVRQFPRRIEIVSPGGFPPGISVDNILDRQLPRNRRIAECLAKCGLVERSGQGANRIFEECVKQSKPLPEFTGTDAFQVALTLHGEVQDPSFLRFLEQAGMSRARPFSTHELLLLDAVRREQRAPAHLQPVLRALSEEGLVESVGRGRGTRYLLSRQYYALAGKRGVYTRKRGLDRATNKALVLKHIQDNPRDGTRFDELRQVLPTLSRDQIQSLLKELRAEERIRSEGRTSAARWYPLTPP